MHKIDSKAVWSFLLFYMALGGWTPFMRGPGRWICGHGERSAPENTCAQLADFALQTVLKVTVDFLPNAMTIHLPHQPALFKMPSRVWLFVTPWTVACQAPLSMGFSRQEHWSGLPFPSPIFKEPMKTPQQRRGQLGYLFSLLSFLWTSLWVKEQLRKMGVTKKKNKK